MVRTKICGQKVAANQTEEMTASVKYTQTVHLEGGEGGHYACTRFAYSTVEQLIRFLMLHFDN